MNIQLKFHKFSIYDWFFLWNEVVSTAIVNCESVQITILTTKLFKLILKISIFLCFLFLTVFQQVKDMWAMLKPKISEKIWSFSLWIVFYLDFTVKNLVTSFNHSAQFLTFQHYVNIQQKFCLHIGFLLLLEIPNKSRPWQ